MAVRPVVVGRTVELAAVEGFLRGLPDGPAALVLTGTAGIGKTSIWEQAVAVAHQDGLTVLSCRCTESDARWAFAGLGDLFDAMPPTATLGLPEVQQRALARALLTSDPSTDPLSERTVAAAVLGALRALAAIRPVLIAVDDVQWLDADSRKVVSFALRRLRDEPVRLLTSCRTGGEPALVADADLGLAGERLHVGPASVGTLQRMVQARLGERFSRPTLTRLHQATGGNPMMFLEMARALQRHGREPGVDEPLPVPADLRELVSARLHGLTDPTRDLLLVAAALAHPTVDTVRAATGGPEPYAAAMAEALAAGVLELEGERIRFTHPLMASTPYEELTPEHRRGLHRRLAQTVTDPEQRARHAALGAEQPAGAVAAALDLAAREARTRGSIDGAAELAELAIGATPTDRAGLTRRTVTAAELQFLLGETVRARSLVTAGLHDAPAGAGRVVGLLLQARIASSEEGDAAVARWCEQALVESGEDPLLQARSHAAFAETSPLGPEIDLMHAQRAVQLLGRIASPPPELFANALTNLALHRCRLGLGLELATLERAVALEGEGSPPPVSDRAGMALGMCLKVVDRFADSRQWLQAMRTAAVDEGDDSALPNILGHLAMLECWSGDYPLAARYAEDGRELAARMGVRAPMLASAHVLTLAHLGRIAEARDLGQRDLDADTALGYHSALALHRRSLGIVEAFAGHTELAAAHLRTALEISRDAVGIGEPAIMRLHPDAVEMLCGAGELAEAQRVTEELDASRDRNGLPWATTMAAHCRGVISAAEGDLPAAITALDEALIHHVGLEMRFEQARSRLRLGRVLRRAGRRTDARTHLEAAHSSFVQLGTPIQAAQALTELASIGGPARDDRTLTGSEQRIARLVGAGQTSREVADGLFMSVRTVDSHLGHIYRKLGLRSRTELAVWVASQPAEGPGDVGRATQRP